REVALEPRRPGRGAGTPQAERVGPRPSAAQPGPRAHVGFRGRPRPAGSANRFRFLRRPAEGIFSASPRFGPYPKMASSAIMSAKNIVVPCCSEPCQARSLPVSHAQLAAVAGGHRSSEQLRQPGFPCSAPLRSSRHSTGFQRKQGVLLVHTNVVQRELTSCFASV
ncbi:hypothetical protein IHE44_0013012, partial [Lamprotornis superbus]